MSIVRKNVGGSTGSKTGFEELNETRAAGNEERVSRSVSVLGLSNTDSLLMGSYGNDSEILDKFAEIAAKVISSSKLKIKIFKLDLDKFNLGFSHVVYAFNADGKAYYTSALLEATNRKPLPISAVVEGMNIKNSLDVLVTSDAFDDAFFEVANAVVSRGLEVTPDTIKFCEGVVVPYDAPVETTAEVVTRFLQDILAANYAKDAGIEKDITIRDVMELTGRNGSLMLDLGFNTGTTINMLGRHVRSDFNVEVSIVRNDAVRSLNKQGGRKKLSTTAGFLEYIISEERNNYTGQIKRVAEPMIILNEFMGSAPTLNYALLSIINANTFTNRNVLKKLIMEKDAGPLNYLFNYGGDGVAKYGEKISFKDPNSKPEIISDIIREHIKPTPIFALDIEEFGSDYPYMMPFSALIDPSAKLLATEAILKAAGELVGSELDARMVAVDECSFIPLGQFQDSEGNIRDIRDIDTVFIAKHINEPSVLIDWIFSNATPSTCQAHTGKNPYTLKLEVLDKISAMLNIKPIITGRGVRVVLHGEFVGELVGRAMANGYNPRMDSPDISYNDYNNLQSIASMYANAAVSSSGFGIQNIRQGYVPNPHFNGYRR